MVQQIKAECIKNGITIKKLEEETGISINTIGKWDTNRPSIDRVIKVADYFGVSIDYLCSRSEDSDVAYASKPSDIELSADEKHIIELFRKASFSDRTRVCSILVDYEETEIKKAKSLA